MKSRFQIALFALLSLLFASRIAIPCSSLVLQGEGTQVYATNYDNEFRSGLITINGRGIAKQGWEPSTTGEFATWTSKYGSVTANLVGVELAWGGMNEAGLVMSTMILAGTEFPFPDPRPPLASPLWMQYLLDTCATVEEVLASEAKVRISDTHDHYLVLDGTGACAAIEFLDGKMVAHVDETMAVPVLTNSRYGKCLDQFMGGETPHPESYDSVQRFLRLAERLETFEEGTQAPVDFAYEALANVAHPTLTRWTLAFDLEERRFWFTTDEHAARRYVDLDEIDFVAGPERRILDIHAELKGNVLEHFGPYDHDVNRDLVRRSLDHFRAGRFTDESVDRIIGLFESFARPETGK